jgi:hypothetical protein
MNPNRPPTPQPRRRPFSAAAARLIAPPLRTAPPKARKLQASAASDGRTKLIPKAPDGPLFGYNPPRSGYASPRARLDAIRADHACRIAVEEKHQGHRARLEAERRALRGAYTEVAAATKKVAEAALAITAHRGAKNAQTQERFERLLRDLDRRPPMRLPRHPSTPLSARMPSVVDVLHEFEHPHRADAPT